MPVCSGMCSELDSQKVDNAVKLKRERSLRRVSEILIAISPRGTEGYLPDIYIFSFFVLFFNISEMARKPHFHRN